MMAEFFSADSFYWSTLKKVPPDDRQGTSETEIKDEPYASSTLQDGDTSIPLIDFIKQEIDELKPELSPGRISNKDHVDTMELSVEEIKLEFDHQDQNDSEGSEAESLNPVNSGQSDQLDVEIKDELSNESSAPSHTDIDSEDTSLVLPEGLCILETNSDDGVKTKGVWTTAFLRKGLMFGPYADPVSKTSSGVIPYDMAWAAFMRPSQGTQHNVVCWRTGGMLYYKTVADIQPLMELQAAPSEREPDYPFSDHNYCIIKPEQNRRTKPAVKLFVCKSCKKGVIMTSHPFKHTC